MEYALDANVFIQASRMYYAFDLCPGFWQSLLHLQASGRVFSIDRIRAEMVNSGDELATWVADTRLDACFESSGDADILTAYAQLVVWVNGQTQFTAAAKTQFATVADAWLMAYAMARGRVVVTHEQFSHDVKRRVPIPNVCQAFDIPCLDSFEMLRALNTTYHWNPP